MKLPNSTSMIPSTTSIWRSVVRSVGVSGLISLVVCGSKNLAAAEPPTSAISSQRLGRAMACGFEKNVGQYSDVVEFALRLPGGALFLTQRGAIFRRVVVAEPDGHGTRCNGTNVHLEVGAGTSDTLVEGIEPLATKFHYFLGNDPGDWRVDVPLYREVLQRDIAPGVSMRWRVRDGIPEYDVEVAAGTMLEDVVFRVLGARSLAIDDGGGIELETAEGNIRQAPPQCYQESESGSRCAMEGRVERIGEDTFRFVADSRSDVVRTIVDPSIEYSTYFGAAMVMHDNVQSMSVDAWGRAVLGGTTGSQHGFPTTPGAFQSKSPTDWNTMLNFISKFAADGSSLEFSTFLGTHEGGFFGGSTLSVLEDGAILIGGSMASEWMPTTPGAYQTIESPLSSAGVCKLGPAGDALVFSTFFGGASYDELSSIDEGVDGCIYFGGTTKSLDFPATFGAFNPVTSTKWRGYVAKLSANGSSLLAATQITSDAGEWVTSVSVTTSGVVAGGFGGSDTIPVTPGAFDTTPNGGDAFIVKFDSSLSILEFGTLYGGWSNEWLYDTAVDKTGAIYFCGETYSHDIPEIPGELAPNSGDDGFIAKLSADGSSMIYSGFYGTNGGEEFGDVAVNSKREAWLTLGASGANLPKTPDALVTYPSGTAVAQLKQDGSGFVYSSYLGGLEFGGIHPSYVALDGSDNAYIAGSTSAAGFPTTAGAYDTVYSGAADAYLTKFRTCGGAFERYGTGCPGTAWSGYGAEPLLIGSGCPKAGAAITISLRKAYGGVPALLLFGLGQGSLAINGSCSLGIAPLAPSLVVPLFVPGIGAGSGSLDLTATLPTSLPTGMVSMQFLVADPGAFAGVAATAPLRMTIAP